MLHFSLPVIVALGFTLLWAALAAVCAVVLAWRVGQTTAAAVVWGAGTFAGAFMMMVPVITLLYGADG
ncbi:hypothetical protein [Streptomyces sp. NPDC058758]|uniref:hypothetical protein n=1 Tax=Streptomyces sp. NPDC058758 TaxID=3346627 RepID=UPI00368B9837